MSRVTGLGHVGLFARDMTTMVDFYTNCLGLQVTDRGPDDRIVFFSARPEEEHHEFVLVRSEDRRTDAQQVSFTVGSLQDLRELYRDIESRGLTIERVVNHGIAFGCYFYDPEGNGIEVYWSTGIDYPQPHMDPIDLEASDEELLALLDQLPPKERV
jgi:catechol-2,3-dioxygenase